MSKENLEGVLTQPQNSENRFKKGLAYYRQKNYEKAIHQLKNVIDVNPKHASAHHYLACCYFNKNNFNQAKIAFKRGVDQNPTNSGLHSNFALTCSMLIQYPIAQQFYLKAIQIQKNKKQETQSEKEKQRFGKNAADHCSSLIKEVYQKIQGQQVYQRKRNTLAQGLTQCPKHGLCNFGMGKILFEQEDYNKAETCFEKAIQANSSNDIFYFYLALNSFLKRQYRKMKENIQKAINLKSSQIKYQVYYGYCLCLQKLQFNIRAEKVTQIVRKINQLSSQNIEELKSNKIYTFIMQSSNKFSSLIQLERQLNQNSQDLFKLNKLNKKCMELHYFLLNSLKKYKYMCYRFNPYASQIIRTFFPFASRDYIQNFCYFSEHLDLQAWNQKQTSLCVSYAGTKVLKALCNKLSYYPFCDQYTGSNKISCKQILITTLNMCNLNNLQGRGIRLSVWLNNAFSILKISQNKLIRQNKIQVGNEKINQVKLRMTFIKKPSSYFLKKSPLIAIIQASEIDYRNIQQCMYNNYFVSASLISNTSNTSPISNNYDKINRHAVIIAGIDQSLGVVYVLNSWGKQYGVRGYHIFSINFPFKQICYVHEQDQIIPVEFIDIAKTNSQNSYLIGQNQRRFTIINNFSEELRKENLQRLSKQQSRNDQQ